MCSISAARSAGIRSDRWVHPVASAFAVDEWFFSERRALTASPAIAAAATAVLAHAGVTIDDVPLIDLYSCFPSAVQIAAGELGLSPWDPGRPLTVTGGLTFAGGPANAYGLHSVATLVERLRESEPGTYGLASALGWYSTKHAYGLYRNGPPPAPFREIDAGPLMRPSAKRVATGTPAPGAVLESYTIPYGRDGEPEAAVISALTPDGARLLHRSTDPALVTHLLEDDPLGQPLELRPGNSAAPVT
jgi:acetyl-CoA C-acetyltransferase